jgi:hypothetical protein
VAGIDRIIVLPKHARMRIRERLGWNEDQVREAAKEVGRIYFKWHRGTKAKIPYRNSVWVIKSREGKALVKTVLNNVEDYSMSEFLSG